MANRSSSDEVTFVHKVFIVVAVCALVGTVWALSDILLLLFGAALFAIALHAMAAPLRVHLRLERRLALSISGAGALASAPTSQTYRRGRLDPLHQIGPRSVPEPAGGASQIGVISNTEEESR
jgi:hypothetical protein